MQSSQMYDDALAAYYYNNDLPLPLVKHNRGVAAAQDIRSNYMTSPVNSIDSNRSSPDYTLPANTNVFTHCYDYAVPTAKRRRLQDSPAGLPTYSMMAQQLTYHSDHQLQPGTIFPPLDPKADPVPAMLAMMPMFSAEGQEELKRIVQYNHNMARRPLPTKERTTKQLLRRVRNTLTCYMSRLNERFQLLVTQEEIKLYTKWCWSNNEAALRASLYLEELKKLQATSATTSSTAAEHANVRLTKRSFRDSLMDSS